MSMSTLARLLALVVPLSIDEKTQIQALDRMQPLLPASPRNAPMTTSGTARKTCSRH
jgi:hypothetical protein